MRIASPFEITLPLRRLSINSLWLLLARVSAQLLSLVLIVLVARRLGAAVLGEYTLIASIVFLGNVATTFGTDSLLIRELGRTRLTGSELVPAAFWLQVGLSIAFIAATFVSSGGTLALPLYSLSLLPLAFYSVYSAVLRGFERMDLFLLLNLAAAALQLLAGLVVLLAGGDLTALLAALVIAQALTASLAWRLSRRYVRSLRVVWPVPRVLRSTAYAALPFALLTTCAVIYQRMGIFALGAMAGNDATGWFSAAARIVETVKVGPQALLGALLPMMAGSPSELTAARLYRTSISLVVGCCFAAAVLLAGFAAPLVEGIYGDAFAPAIGALAILAWGLVPFAITSNLTVRMVAAGHEWNVLAGTAAAIALALLLYLTLVPRYGVTGACWAAVLAETGQASLFWMIKRHIGI